MPEHGKVVELFLVNGSADGLITAEISNWNGKALKIPRKDVGHCDRNDLQQPGVYFLFCKDDDDSDSVYIGEAENVKNRLVQHMQSYDAEKEKYYWNTAVVFIGSDLNKAHIRYLENRFVEIAMKRKRYTVLTKNTYSHTVLKESQIAAMEEFIDNAEILMEALGYRVLKDISSEVAPQKPVIKPPDREATRLYLEKAVDDGNVIKAEGGQTSEGFVVLHGSRISPEEEDTIPAVIKKRRMSATIDENGILQEDMLFSTPGGAAVFVLGKNVNGMTSWKTADGETLKSLENKENHDQ